MKRLLLDQGLPRSTVEILNKKGWDVLHVSDIGLGQAEDAEILAFACKTKRIVVTLDADFHALLAMDRKKTCTVIRIREEGLRAENLVQLVSKIWPKIKNHIEHGALISVTSQSVRIKRLPVLK